MLRLRCRQDGEGGYRKEKENPFVIPLESLRILGNPFGAHKNAWGMSRNSLRILRKERRVRARGGGISENPKKFQTYQFPYVKLIHSGWFSYARVG